MKNKKPITFRKKLDNPVFKKLALAFVIVIIATATYLQYLAPHTLEAKQRVELESTQHQLIETKRTLQDQKTLDAQQDAEKQKQLEEIQKKLEETEKALQAKRSTPQGSTAMAVSPARVTVSGTCADWIAQAGIPDVANAQELIRRESGCNPNAVNPSSGACGVAQELPCGKSGCSLGDGACQVRWMNSYVHQRYGSWANAVAWHNAHNWY